VVQVVALDSETGVTAPARMAPPLVCVSEAGSRTKLWHVLDPDLVPYLEATFERAAAGELLIVGHHFAYDAAVFISHAPSLAEVVFAAYDAGQVGDTMIRQKLLDIAGGCYRGYTDPRTGKSTVYKYSLDALAQRHFNRKLDKEGPWRLHYARLLDVPLDDWPHDAVDYAMGDAVTTLDAWCIQEEQAGRDPGVLEDEPRQVRAALALQLASVWGIRTDPEMVQRLKRDAEDEIAAVRPILIEAGLIRSNGCRRMKYAQERMLEVNPNGKKTDTGRPCVDEEACEDTGDPAFIALARYGKAQNLISKDVKALATGVRLPIHTRFDSLMETGRTSSSGTYNLQNPRRKQGVRECFVPREGNVLVACDYDKAELHTLSQVCIMVTGKSRLGERLNAGFDPHLDLGAQLLGITYDEAALRKKDPEVKNARQASKAGNFGYPGGMGPKGFQAYAKTQYGVDFDLTFCKKLRENWLQTWPEVEEYFDWVRRLCGEAGIANVIHFFSNRRRGLIPYTVACNTFFQGLAADGAKAAMWQICRRQYADPGSPLWGTRTVNFVHDEFIIEAPEGHAHDAAMELQRVMVDEYSKWVPDVPVRASPAIMRRWSKAAEPAWRNGKLIPWEDREEATTC